MENVCRVNLEKKIQNKRKQAAIKEKRNIKIHKMEMKTRFACVVKNVFAYDEIGTHAARR